MNARDNRRRKAKAAKKLGRWWLTREWDRILDAIDLRLEAADFSPMERHQTTLLTAPDWHSKNTIMAFLEVKSAAMPKSTTVGNFLLGTPRMKSVLPVMTNRPRPLKDTT